MVKLIEILEKTNNKLHHTLYENSTSNTIMAKALLFWWCGISWYWRQGFTTKGYSWKDIREVAKLITEHGVTERNKEPTLKLSKISEMSIMLTVQTTAALVGFHLTTPSFLTKVLLIVVLIVQLVAWLACCLDIGI